MQAREMDRLQGASPAPIPEEERDQDGSSPDAQHNGGLSDTVRAPSTLDKQIAQERAAAGSETPVGLPRVATASTASSMQAKQEPPIMPAAAHGSAQEQAAGPRSKDTGREAVQGPPGVSDGDVGHLPVARQENTPDRELTDPGHMTDPVHMTPSSSPRMLVKLLPMHCTTGNWFESNLLHVVSQTTFRHRRAQDAVPSSACKGSSAWTLCLPLGQTLPLELSLSSLHRQTPKFAAWMLQDEAASGLEQWEMVVGAARLYDWSGGSRLRSPRASLQRGASADSQAPDTLRTRERPLPIPGHVLISALVLSLLIC